MPYKSWASKWWEIRVKPEAKRANMCSDHEKERQRRPQGSRESQWRQGKPVPRLPIADRPMVYIIIMLQ